MNGIFQKLKRYIKDFSLRISASVITTVANQIVLLPVLADIFSQTEYGIILTIIGIKNIISGTLGNSLYSTRLVVDSKYRENNQTGDFNFLAVLSSVLSAAVMIITALFIKEIDTITLLLLIPTIILYTFNAYATVWYTVKLEFKKSLVHSIVVSIGTLVGVGLVKITNLWPLAYLATATFGFIFVMTQTKIVRESFRFTGLFKTTTGKWTILCLATLLTNLVTYLDRLILYPILGSDAVAIFSTASYFGKAVSVIAMPIAGVLLGYYAQKNFRMTVKLFWIINAVCGVVLLGFGIFSLFFGKTVTGWLFPKLIEDAAPYIFIANVSSAIAAVIQLVQSASLKYAKTFWQIVIQIVYLGVYFGMGIVLMKQGGLMGFCYASLIANIIRLCMLLIISHFSIKNQVIA